MPPRARPRQPRRLIRKAERNMLHQMYNIGPANMYDRHAARVCYSSTNCLQIVAVIIVKTNHKSHRSLDYCELQA